MKKIFVTIFISIIFLGSSNFLNKADAKEITNLQWKKSVAKGKKLSKFRETVTSPALGEKAWKITLLPRDCGRDQDGDYSDCTNNEEEIEQEVSIQQNQDIRVRNGSQLVFLFQKILKQLNLLVLLYFRFMNGEILINKDILG